MIPTHNSAAEMLDLLVGYMNDNTSIQRAILWEFGWKPTISQIEGARLCREMRDKKFKTKYDIKPNKGGNGENDKHIFSAIRIGSDALRRQILKQHPRIMKVLEARGNKVVWDG